MEGKINFRNSVKGVMSTFQDAQKEAWSDFKNVLEKCRGEYDEENGD